MAIPNNLGSREQEKFVESASVANKAVVAVANPDGTDIGSSTSLTEFPAPAALSDTTTNPTTTQVGAANEVYNAASTQWERWRKMVTGLDSTGTGIGAVGLVAQYDDTTPSSVTENQFGNVRMNSARQLYADLGTTIAGENIAQDVLGTNHKPVASATYSGTGGMAPLTDVDVSVKASAGNILSVTCSNINAAIRYLQIHNKATAPANPDVPIFSFAIPAGSATVPAMREIGRDFFGAGGYYLSTGIAIGVSTTAATFTAATTTDHTTNWTYI